MFLDDIEKRLTKILSMYDNPRLWPCRFLRETIKQLLNQCYKWRVGMRLIGLCRNFATCLPEDHRYSYNETRKTGEIAIVDRFEVAEGRITFQGQLCQQQVERLKLVCTEHRIRHGVAAK